MKIFAVHLINCTHLNIALGSSVISPLWHLESSRYIHSMFTSSKTSDPVFKIKFNSRNIKIFAVYLIKCTHLR